MLCWSIPLFLYGRPCERTSSTEVYYLLECVCMYVLYVCMMSFRLIDDRVNMASPDDISYVSAGDIYSQNHVCMYVCWHVYIHLQSWEYLRLNWTFILLGYAPMLVRLVQALALNSNSWQQHANVSSNQYIRSILEWNIHSYILYLYTYIHAYIHTVWRRPT
jgi:hypothetical protein